MLEKRFILLFCIITTLGLLLRLVNYTQVPALGETRDEFMYPWAGLTLLQTGTPSSWSYFESYTQRTSIYLWDQEFRIVTPWFDKPLLYPLLTGGFLWLFGARDFADVNLMFLRLIPIGLSIPTLVLLTLIARDVFSKKVALIAATLYATVTTIVLANRLSLTENLLTPLFLGITLLTLRLRNNSQLITIGILSGLAFHTKQIGAAVIGYPLALLILKRDYKKVLLLLSIFLACVAIYFLVVAWYDWGLYLRVMSDFRHAHALAGLPELIQTIFRFPTISQKTRLLLDGSILAGLILLLARPFYTANESKKGMALIVVPLAYVTVLTLVESGGTNFSYFGWHIYPLFPFMMIGLASHMSYLYQTVRFTPLLLLLLTIGTSCIRFLFLLLPIQYHHLWQYTLAALISLVLLIWLFTPRLRRMSLAFFFVTYLIVNIITTLTLNRTYPTTAAHLDSWEGVR